MTITKQALGEPEIRLDDRRSYPDGKNRRFPLFPVGRFPLSERADAAPAAQQPPPASPPSSLFVAGLSASEVEALKSLLTIAPKLLALAEQQEQQEQQEQRAAEPPVATDQLGESLAEKIRNAHRGVKPATSDRPHPADPRSFLKLKPEEMGPKIVADESRTDTRDDTSTWLIEKIRQANRRN